MDAIAGGGSNKLLYGTIILFVVAIIVNVIILGVSVSGTESAKEAKKGVTSMAIVNGILTLVLMFLALFYFGQNAAYERTYSIIMTHLAIFISLLTLGISLMQKI